MRKVKNLFLPIAAVLLAVTLPAPCEEPPRLIVPLIKSDAPNNQDEQQGAYPMGRYILPPTGYSARKRSKKSEKGKLLYTQFNCAECHSIKGEGGEIGPPLDGVGGHRGRQWLTARVLDPEQQRQDFPELFGNQPSVMAHRVQKRSDAELLSEYLLTLEEPKRGFAVARHPGDKESESTAGKQTSDALPQSDNEAAKSGRELFSTLHCAACHSLDGSHDRFGPDLAGIGSHLSEKKLERILGGAVRSAVMKKQAHNLGDEQIYDIKTFLLTLPEKNSPENKTD